MIGSEITLNDIREIRELQPEGWPDIIPYFDFYINSSFCDPIKISVNNRIVGIGAAILHMHSAWLGHIIVHKDFRNQGIGKFVTQSLITRIDSEQYPTVSLIATELGEPVYNKLGFEKTTDYHFYRRETSAPFSVHSEFIKEADKSFYEEMLALDRYVSGEDRSLFLQQYLPASKLYIHKDELLGFYMPELGDGLVVAKEPLAGVELLKLSLSTKRFCVLPQDNKKAIEFLKLSDFKYARSGARMILGKPLDFKANMLFSRIGGNVG